MNAQQLAAFLARNPEQAQRFQTTETAPDWPLRFAVSAAVIARGGTVEQASAAVWQALQPQREAQA